MTKSPDFIFDSSAWIGAWSELYAPDVFPSVWTRMADAAEEGVIASPQKVVDEIAAKDDALNKWMAPHQKTLTGILRASDREPEAENLVAELVNKHDRLVTRTGADYYVVAWAKLLRIPLVATENPGATSPKKLAGVCRNEEVEYLSPLQFMQRQKWKIK